MRRLTALFLIVGYLSAPGVVPAQPSGSDPLFETRGVWFATVLGDGNWPENGTDDPADKQASDLRNRIRMSSDLGMNTFVFQVVARGDAYFASARLPWTHRLAGPGMDPGYDPLAVAVDEAHKLGMELHAWINVFRVGDSQTLDLFTGVSDPQHVAYSNPGWVQSEGSNLWIDPSISEARAWLVENVLEMVENYDIDAVHFDFIRYPRGGFGSDVANYQFDPRGLSIDDWRRDNITLFVEEAYRQITALKPWVKIGSTPLGNYQPFDGAWPALWAFSDVWQESRAWLNGGVNDYLAPQIYWDIGREPRPGNTFDSPDFAFLTEEWVTQTNGLPIFTGVAAYRPEVIVEIETQIDTARAVGASGQLFFRYDHIRDYGRPDRYRHRSLPAPMTQRFDAAAPTDPTELSIEGVAGNGIRLDWAPSFGTTSDPLRGYAVFRRTGVPPDAQEAQDLIAFVPASSNSFEDRNLDPGAGPFHYRIVAVSRLGFASEPSDAVSTDQVLVSTEPVERPGTLAIEGVYPNPATGLVTLRFDAPPHQRIGLILLDVLGRTVIKKQYPIGTSGIYTVEIPVEELPAGVYFIRLESGQANDVTRIVVSR